MHCRMLLSRISGVMEAAERLSAFFSDRVGSEFDAPAGPSGTVRAQCIVGPPGSGRTSLAFQLAQALAASGRAVLLLCIRERMHASPPRTCLDARAGNPATLRRIAIK